MLRVLAITRRPLSSAPRTAVTATGATRAPGAHATDPRLLEFAAKTATPATLRELYEVGRARDAVRAAAFLHAELPIRMAQRICDLRDLFGDEVADLAAYYEGAVYELAATAPPTDAATERAFAKTLSALMSDARAVPRALAAAVRRRNAGPMAARLSGAAPGAAGGLDAAAWVERLAFDDRLASFFTARVGLRLLVEHYLALRDPAAPPGLLAECRPAAVARDAAGAVVALARDAYGGAAPAIDVVGDDGAELTYVPGHMRFALLELLKNAARASVERDPGAAPPPIRVVVADGVEDVTFKVADEGGGCARSTRHSMWSWFWSSGASLGAQGGGLGLPLTRCLARYFGGDLALRPLEGHGTDAYLHLSKLGDRCEALPRAVARSPANSDSTTVRVSEAYAFFDEHGLDPHREARRRPPPPSVDS